MSQDKVAHEWHIPTGSTYRPFYSKRVNLANALHWLTTIFWTFVTITYDCKSLVQVVYNQYPTDTTIIALQQRTVNITINKQLFVIWVPSHCNVPGNELADSKRKPSSSMIQPEFPKDNTTHRALIHNECRLTPLISTIKWSLLIDPQEKQETKMTKADIIELIHS